MKTVRIHLWRRLPPFRRRVTVGQITVAGFLELIRLLVSHSAAVHRRIGHEVTADELLRELREPEFNALADAVCKGEDPGFFSGWLSLRNVRALYDASFMVNNWRRIFGCVDWSGQKKKRKGSILSDIQVVSRVYGIDPYSIEQWPMEYFLGFIEEMNLTMQPEPLEATPVDVLGMIPGVGVVH